MMNVDCIAWQGLSTGRKQVERMKAFPQVDAVDKQMLELANAVLGDARRREAVRKDCPARFKEMEELVGGPGATSSVPLDVALISQRLAGLDDIAFEEIERAVSAERARRGSVD